MLRSKSSFFFFAFSLFTLFSLQGCGDDKDRAKGATTEYGDLIDLRMGSLVVNAGALEPEFDPDYAGVYTLTVDSDVASIDITAAPLNESVALRISKRELERDENGDPVLLDNGANSYNWTAELNEIEAGEVDTKTLTPGENLIEFRLSTEGSLSHLTYSLSVHRVNTEAKLLDIAVTSEGYELSEEDDPYRPALNETFDPTIADYSVTVPYESCMVTIGAKTNERYTTLTIGGEEASHLQFVPFMVAEGDNVFDLVATAEDGVGVESYSLTVTRTEGTTEQLETDATLASFSVAGGEMNRQFGCLLPEYGVSYNNDVDTVQLTAAASVEGATILLGTPQIDDDGLFENELIDSVALTSGVPFDLSVAGEEMFVRVIEVTASNGSDKRYYFIYFDRRETNWVRVETAEELQAALLNAEPNDEIVVRPTYYAGTASLETSGHEDAIFFSDRSGTADTPIILRSASSSALPILLGESETALDVLRLSGDHWQIKGMQTYGGRNGIVLDGASNNLLESLLVSHMDERGIQLRNGSSNNVIQSSQISNTGLSPREGLEFYGEAIVVGSNADDWSIAPSGTADEKDYDNKLHHNIFGPKVMAQAINIREGVVGTEIKYNLVDGEGVSADASNGALISVNGNQTDISYNSFINESGENLTALVRAANVSRDWLTDSWGEATRFYQNSADLGNADIPLADSGDVASFSVADNTRKDSVEPSYSGAGINASFQTPVFQLQTTVDEPLCLAEERPYPNRADIDTSTRPVSPLVLMQTCSSSSEQLWKFVHDDNGFIFIVPADVPERVVLPHTPSFVGTAGVHAVTLDPSDDILWLANPEDGYFLRWKPLHRDDEVIFINKGDWALRYVLAGETEVGESAKVKDTLSAELQRFRIVYSD